MDADDPLGGSWQACLHITRWFFPGCWFMRLQGRCHLSARDKSHSGVNCQPGLLVLLLPCLAACCGEGEQHFPVFAHQRLMRLTLVFFCIARSCRTGLSHKQAQMFYLVTLFSHACMPGKIRAGGGSGWMHVTYYRSCCTWTGRLGVDKKGVWREQLMQCVGSYSLRRRRYTGGNKKMK